MTHHPLDTAPPPDRIPAKLFFAILATGTFFGSIAYFVNPYFFQFYGDANSRIVQTRMMLDSLSPGLHWIGTVWLPLPELLFLPFALIDTFFFTGIAGFLVCMPLLGWSAVLLYRLLLRLTGDSDIAGLGALFFGLNPNTLYVSMTTMTETVTLFFFIAAVWNWAQWLERRLDADAWKKLAIGCLSAAAATLCRYETWIFTGVATAGLVLFIATTRVSLRRKAGLAGLLLLSFLGIALWLAWNKYRFGDMMYFNHAEYYSAAWQAKHRAVRASYYLQVWSSLGIYGITMVAMYGPLYLIASAIGFRQLAERRPRAETLFLAVVLLVMPLFTLFSLYIGVAEMTQWWNSRYVLLLAPFVTVTVALSFARWKAAARPPRALRRVMIAVFLVTLAYQLTLQKGLVVTVADAAGGFYFLPTPYATETGEELGRLWKGGTILSAAGSGQTHRVIQSSHVGTRNFVIAIDIDRHLFDIPTVANEFAWVIVGLQPGDDGAEIARFLAAHASELEKTHRRVFANKYYIAFQRIR
jgi:hypothetical protein